jgi:protein-S-isoprenylcysteine O-methyltransferase Ste14
MSSVPTAQQGTELGLVAGTLNLLFSIVAYLAFLGSFLLLAAFLTNATTLVPTIDQGRDAGGVLAALVVDLGLITLFAMQHSIMARSGFKAWLTRHVARSVERSVFVLAASLCLIALCMLWAPLPQPVWQAATPKLALLAWALFGIGLAIVLLSTFLIDHFDLFGLKQGWSAFIGQRVEEAEFVTPWLYRFVRHPLYLGFVIAFFATPTMTLGHLFFAVTMTVYILIAIRFEERDLIAKHGDHYRDYRAKVPMLVPGTRRAS